MFKNKKNFIAMLVATFLLLAITNGCGGKKETQKAPATDVLKLGANMEMTGTNASFGQSGVKGIQLAIKEINAKGGILDGKKLSLVIADTKSEPSEAAISLQKLIANDKVVAVIGPMTSSSVIAGAEINQSSKVLGISPAGTNPAVTVNPATGKTREYLFRTAFIDPFQGLVMANFASKTLKAQTAVLYIENTSDYAKGLGKFFEETFVKNGGKIIGTEAYLQKDTDFKATLTKIKALNPEVVFLPGYYQEVGLIIKQARELGITAIFLGGDGWDSVKLPEIAGKGSLANTYFSNHYSPDDSSKEVKTFVIAYKKEYNEIPDGFAALSYDSTMMIADAIKRAGSADTVKIRDELEKTDGFKGVSGIMTFNDKHDPIKSAVIIEFGDGKQVFKEKINP